MNHNTHIKNALLGQFCNCFQLSDFWTFSFGQRKLTCHEIRFSNEVELQQTLKPYIDSVEPIDVADVARCTAIAAHMRKPISCVELDSDCSLTLSFESGETLTVLANVDTVDWQWSISEFGGCPHTNGYELACFSRGSVDEYAG